MLLQFLLDTPTNFTWQNYKAPPLPEVQLTTEIVATWLLTFLFRKPKPGEPNIPVQVWHRVLQFLRENHQHEELKLLFEFIKKYQMDIVTRNLMPNWLHVVLAPLCGSDAASLSSALSNTFDPSQQFWHNALQGLTPALLPFWFTEPTSYIWQHLLYTLTQQPLSEEIKRFIQTFFTGKPLEFFIGMRIDLLIILTNIGFITKSNLVKILFFANRRINPLLGLKFFFDENMSNPLVQTYLKTNFRSIWVYISETSPVNRNEAFFMVFKNPHIFFRKLIETEGLLVRSKIQGPDMAKFLNLFCWNTSIFFPTCMSLDRFIYQIMSLPENWRFLFVQLWRCEPRRFSEFHIGELIRNFCLFEKCFYSRSLASMMKVYMNEVVKNLDPESRKIFFKWILEQKQSIQAHFPLTPELVEYCLYIFPGSATKKRLFWWIYTLYASLNECSERDFTVNMDQICTLMHLPVTKEELELSASNGFSPAWYVSQFFGIITLKFQFDGWTTKLDFLNVAWCDRLPPSENPNLFRVLVIGIKRALFPHVNPDQPKSCNGLIDLVSSCEQHLESLKSMSADDLSFLIQIFQKYLPVLSLSEELLQLLHRLSELMPEGVSQAMFANCYSLNLLHKEKVGCKRSRDPTDQASYEAKCSRCGHFFPLEIIGPDGHGGAICLRCSQANKCPFSKTLDKISFGRL